MKYKMPKALLVLCLGISLIGIISAGERQPDTYGAYPGAPSSTGAATAIYSTQAPPDSQQKVLLSYNVQATPPSAVYYNETFMPWMSFHQIFPAKSPVLWVDSSAGWSWYATCPVGDWVQELIYVPVTGTTKICDIYPDGTTKCNNYGSNEPGYNYRWFNANMTGRHITMLTVADIPSNYIIIDVA